MVFSLDTCLTKFWDLFFSQKNWASLNLASTTLSFPAFMKPYASLLFATTKNSFVILPFLSKVGKYF